MLAFVRYEKNAIATRAAALDAFEKLFVVYDEHAVIKSERGAFFNGFEDIDFGERDVSSPWLQAVFKSFAIAFKPSDDDEDIEPEVKVALLTALGCLCDASSARLREAKKRSSYDYTPVLDVFREDIDEATRDWPLEEKQRRRQ